MKKGVIFLLICAVLLMFSGQAFAADPISVYVDEVQISFDVEPTIVEGTTLVPMRAIFEAIGAQVSWDEASRTAIGIKNNNEVKVTIGAAQGYKNGQAIQLLQPAQIHNGRTLVPLRFVSESLNCNVNWDAATRTITIETNADSTTVDQNTTVTPQQPANNDSNFTGKYYITKTGTKYHYLNNCGNGTYYETTWEEIQKRNLEPCEKCVY